MTSAGLRRIGDFLHPDAIKEKLETFFDGMTDAEREHSMIWQMWGGQFCSCVCFSMMLGPCCVVQHKLLLCYLQKSSEQGREGPGASAIIIVEHSLCSNARGPVA